MPSIVDNCLERTDNAGLSPLEVKKLRELLKLLQYVDLDDQGALVIRSKNGKARLVFKEDGTLRAEGVRVVTTADETLLLDAAVIALN